MQRLYTRDVIILHQKITNSARDLQILRTILRILCKFCATFQPVFSMVKLSVTPVYYPEYRGLLVHLSLELLFNLHLVLDC